MRSLTAPGTLGDPKAGKPRTPAVAAYVGEQGARTNTLSPSEAVGGIHVDEAQLGVLTSQ